MSARLRAPQGGHGGEPEIGLKESGRVAFRVAAARRALARGKLQEAESHARIALVESGRSARIRLLLARIALGQWSARNAVRQLEAALKSSPSQRTYLMLSAANARLDNRPQAMTWARQAFEQNPGDVGATRWLGQCCLDAGEFLEAETCFRKAIEQEPAQAEWRHALGMALQALGRHGEAMLCFDAAAELAPESAKYRIDLTEQLLNLNDLPGAAESARTLLDIAPERAISHVLMAQSLAEKDEAAEVEARAAVALEPHDAMPHAALSSILMMRGKLDEAQAECETSIDLEPMQGLGYFNLLRCRRSQADDLPFLERLDDLLADGGLPPGQRGLLAFGLGRAYEDLGRYEESMARYDEANRVECRRKFGDEPYDMEINRASFETVIRRNPAALFAGGAGSEPQRPAGGVRRIEFAATSESASPIFVFGMIRSGTTLVEQILSSHPDVVGAGEQAFWPMNRTAAYFGDALDPFSLRTLADQYLEALDRFGPGSRFVVDKMPMNYLNVGLLHLAFPQAPLIHVVRNPIDTGLSIYATHNRVMIPWSHDKDQIALNYERYAGLMAHWRQVLPPGRMIEVGYEALVSDPKLQIERLISACGLEWNDACLHPEQNQRGVSTPSVWQVRQPIYTSSVARCKRFEPWLGGLARLKEAAAFEG